MVHLLKIEPDVEVGSLNRAIDTEIDHHLRMLCKEIGCRPIGSPANRTAAAYIATVFRSAGLETEELTFHCPDWRDEGTLLEVDGRPLAAYANAFSPSCSEEAPGILLGTEGELLAAELTGRIGILYGDLARGPLTPKSCTLYPADRDWRIVDMLTEKHPLALVTVNPKPGLRVRVIEDWDFPIPSATVAAAAGRELMQGISSGSRIRLRIDSNSRPGRAAHVIGRKRNQGEQRIVLCAHFDTKIDTPGAVDNAGGTAALLALADMLVSKKLPVGLEFVAFNAEEYGGTQNDSDLYFQHYGDRLGTVLAAVNMDGIGYSVSSNNVATFAASDALTGEVERLLQGFPRMHWTEPWPQSNHSSFAFRGVPSVALSSGAWEVAHRPEDSLEWVSPEKLSEAAIFAAGLAGSLADRSLEWTRPS